MKMLPFAKQKGNLIVLTGYHCAKRTLLVSQIMVKAQEVRSHRIHLIKSTMTLCIFFTSVKNPIPIKYECLYLFKLIRNKFGLHYKFPIEMLFYGHALGLYLSSTAWISINGFRNSSSSFTFNWLAASHSALVGSGCVSINIPSTPAATPDRPRTGKNSLAPPFVSALGIPYLRMA